MKKRTSGLQQFYGDAELTEVRVEEQTRVMLTFDMCDGKGTVRTVVCAGVKNTLPVQVLLASAPLPRAVLELVVEQRSDRSSQLRIELAGGVVREIVCRDLWEQ